jgi:hypothetical protein
LQAIRLFKSEGDVSVEIKIALNVIVFEHPCHSTFSIAYELKTDLVHTPFERRYFSKCSKYVRYIVCVVLFELCPVSTRGSCAFVPAC